MIRVYFCFNSYNDFYNVIRTCFDKKLDWIHQKSKEIHEKKNIKVKISVSHKTTDFRIQFFQTNTLYLNVHYPKQEKLREIKFMHVKKEDFAASNQEEHLKVFLDFNILVKKVHWLLMTIRTIHQHKL